MTRILLSLGLLAALASRPAVDTLNPTNGSTSEMELGTFSVSLAVEDLSASREFYEKLGLVVS